MKRPPSFRFYPDKFVEAVDYLVREVGPCTRMSLVKLLYLADRRHLVRHGTPILGDRYYRLPYGPVPSRALDLLEATADLEAGEPDAVADDVTRCLLARIRVGSPDRKTATYEPRGERVRPEALAPSELDALHEVAIRFGRWTAFQLSELTHGHRAYVDTPPTDEIDYRLFFLDEPDVNPDAYRYLEQSQEDRDLLEAL